MSKFDSSPIYVVYAMHHMYCRNTIWGDTQNYENNGERSTNIISKIAMYMTVRARYVCVRVGPNTREKQREKYENDAIRP